MLQTPLQMAIYVISAQKNRTRACARIRFFFLADEEKNQAFNAVNTSSSIFLASPNSMRLFSL